MEKIYLIGNIPNFIYRKYSLPSDVENIYIDPKRFEVLRKSFPLFCLDKAPYTGHGSVILFYQYYFQRSYHDSFIPLIEYMTKNSIHKMKIDVVGFIVINNEETSEVLFNHHAVSGYFKLDDVMFFESSEDSFEDVFYPLQKRKFFLQKHLLSKDINKMFSKENKVSPYSPLEYLLHKTITEGEGKVVSHELVGDYCKGNQKIELF